MGEFDIDDHGNYVLIRGNDGKLNDKLGNRVNQRGYLIDVQGNVVTNSKKSNKS